MKVHIKTYGCSANQSDTQIMKAILERSGHEISSEENAEIIIINSCTVKSPTENKILKEINRLKGKRIILAGCIPQSNPDKIRKNYPKIRIIGPGAIHKICDIIEKEKEILEDAKINKAKLPAKNENKAVSIHQISTGCLGNCTFCMTKKARGTLHSYPVKDIVNNIIKYGRKEIWLTSQDTGCYGYDIKTSLPKLLTAVIKIKKKFKIRIGMMNPNYAKKMLPELLKITKTKKVYKFLHIPIQSGSDKVLKEMNRQYTAKEFIQIVKKAREEIPMITISTDIITGYPTETDDDFKETVKIIKRTKPDIINISMYCEREGTKAVELKQQPNWVRKERSRIITKIFNRIALKNNKKWIGWEGKILVTEQGKNNTCIGRNYTYKPVVVKKERIGKEIKVKVINAKAHYLIGEKI